MTEPIKYLVGNKVYLRPFEQTDVEFMHRIVNNDVEVRRLTGAQNAFSLAQIQDYIDRQWQDGSRVCFGIVRLEDDQLVGEVVLNEINRNNRSANFRILVAQDLTGRGYGTEATCLMLDHGFGMLNLHRVELDVYTINSRAAHVYEKVGFKREGVKRENWYYNHQYYDSIVMSILEHEFCPMHPRT
jgi:RimJ/RimL family protein N-acetyltransferase